MFKENVSKKEFEERMELQNKAISNLNESVKSLVENLTTLNNFVGDLQDSLQNSTMELAKNGVIHKECITFLLNNASLDSESQEDFVKLLDKISNNEKIIKKRLEEVKNGR